MNVIRCRVTFTEGPQMVLDINTKCHMHWENVDVENNKILGIDLWFEEDAQ